MVSSILFRSLKAQRPIIISKNLSTSETVLFGLPWKAFLFGRSINLGIFEFAYVIHSCMTSSEDKTNSNLNFFRIFTWLFRKKKVCWTNTPGRTVCPSKIDHAKPLLDLGAKLRDHNKNLRLFGVFMVRMDNGKNYILVTLLNGDRCFSTFVLVAFEILFP